jgi:hypothetical protein
MRLLAITAGGDLHSAPRTFTAKAQALTIDAMMQVSPALRKIRGMPAIAT